MFTIGCHLSASKGFLAMGKTAVSIGANTFQFFTRNPRGGTAKALDQSDIDAFLEYSREHGIGIILAHAPYTLNACSKDEKIREFAKNTMADDLRRMEAVPGNLYNFHPGSHVGQGIETGIEQISAQLNELLTPELTTTVLLETMAGKGSEVGSRFEEIKAIIDRVDLKDKLGVCLDTCHVHDAGYDVVNDLDGVLSAFDRVIGIDRLRAVHINDSKNPFESHKDRHEVIGGGSIGTEAFARIINHPQLCGLPFYLETPNELEGYAKEIAMLKDLRADKPAAKA
ncbi:deoxyribonuclease IV [Congzhengia sp.]|jgi:deoxyribonuclease-4|uniref:deoxyribonuclease IV n=1 Tax=Congzhengia sp. TaxID=2944168 RepID=UPI003077B42E